MKPSVFESLTEEQRHCLRLTSEGFTSKQIALPLGLHHRAIDQRLDRARRTLGEPDRASAARAFARYEAKVAGYDRVIRDPPPLASPPVEPETVEATWGERESSVLDVVREAPASAPWSYSSRPDAPEKNGQRNLLSPTKRVALTLATIVALVLSIVAAPALMDSFHRVANSIRPHH